MMRVCTAGQNDSVGAARNNDVKSQECDDNGQSRITGVDEELRSIFPLFLVTNG